MTLEDRVHGTRFPAPCPATRSANGQRQRRMPRSRDLANALLPMEEAIHTLRNRWIASSTNRSTSGTTPSTGCHQRMQDQRRLIGSVLCRLIIVPVGVAAATQ